VSQTRRGLSNPFSLHERPDEGQPDIDPVGLGAISGSGAGRGNTTDRCVSLILRAAKARAVESMLIRPGRRRSQGPAGIGD
jgi:hypothetical protein